VSTHTNSRFKSYRTVWGIGPHVPIEKWPSGVRASEHQKAYSLVLGVSNTASRM
jgi:hypothetical protein